MIGTSHRSTSQTFYDQAIILKNHFVIQAKVIRVNQSIFIGRCFWDMLLQRRVHNKLLGCQDVKMSRKN